MHCFVLIFTDANDPLLLPFQRDDLLKTANIPALEAKCDEIIVELESNRDLSRTLVHFDAGESYASLPSTKTESEYTTADAFYANVEELANPKLIGVAFGVGGGVLTTASYEARKFGVRSGMAGFVAKKLCPHLKFVKANFSSYRQVVNLKESMKLSADPSTSDT